MSKNVSDGYYIFTEQSLNGSKAALLVTAIYETLRLWTWLTCNITINCSEKQTGKYNFKYKDRD